MERVIFNITSELMLKLGITATDCVEYIEGKDVSTITPAHVKALDILRHSSVASS